MRKVHCHCVTSASLQWNLGRRGLSCGQSLSLHYRKRWRSTTTHDRTLQGSWPSRGQRPSKISSLRSRAPLNGTIQYTTRRCLHSSIRRQGPLRPPPIRPTLAGGVVAPRVSSVVKQGFGDDDFTIRTNQETADRAAEKARALREKKAEEDALERKHAYKLDLFRKQIRDCTQRLQAIDLQARKIRNSVPSVLRQAHADGKQDWSNFKAWQRYRTEQIWPLEKRLQKLQQVLIALEQQVIYNLRMIQYTSRWWEWRHESLDEQAPKAWQMEQLLKSDGEDYNDTSHGQMKGLASKLTHTYADIARLLQLSVRSDSPLKLKPRSKLEMSLRSSEYNFHQHSEHAHTKIDIYGGGGLPRLAHNYRDINRVAMVSAFLPEIAYEVWLMDLHTLVDRLRDGYAQMKSQLKFYWMIFDSMRQIDRYMWDRYDKWNTKDMSACLSILHRGFAFHNPALSSRFGTDVIALLRPFQIYSSATAKIGGATNTLEKLLARSDSHMRIKHPDLLPKISLYTSRLRGNRDIGISSHVRDMFDSFRIFKFKSIDSLLRFEKRPVTWTNELLRRQTKIFPSLPLSQVEDGKIIVGFDHMLEAWGADSYIPMISPEPTGPRHSPAVKKRPRKPSERHKLERKSPSIKILKVKSHDHIKNSTYTRTQLESADSTIITFKSSESVSKDTASSILADISFESPSRVVTNVPPKVKTQPIQANAGPEQILSGTDISRDSDSRDGKEQSDHNASIPSRAKSLLKRVIWPTSSQETPRDNEEAPRPPSSEQKTSSNEKIATYKIRRLKALSYGEPVVKRKLTDQNSSSGSGSALITGTRHINLKEKRSMSGSEQLQ